MRRRYKIALGICALIGVYAAGNFARSGAIDRCLLEAEEHDPSNDEVSYKRANIVRACMTVNGYHYDPALTLGTEENKWLAFDEDSYSPALWRIDGLVFQLRKLVA